MVYLCIKRNIVMEEKIYCNICNILIYCDTIENHIITPKHMNSKKRYTQQLFSVEVDTKITNKSTYDVWKNSKN
jgi:hypothetical protein